MESHLLPVVMCRLHLSLRLCSELQEGYGKPALRLWSGSGAGELRQPKYLLNSASKWVSFPPGQVADFTTTKDGLGSALGPERPSTLLSLSSETPLTSPSFNAQLNELPRKIPCVCAMLGRLKGAEGQTSLRSFDRVKGRETPLAILSVESSA